MEYIARFSLQDKLYYLICFLLVLNRFFAMQNFSVRENINNLLSKYLLNYETNFIIISVFY